MSKVMKVAGKKTRGIWELAGKTTEKSGIDCGRINVWSTNWLYDGYAQQNCNAVFLLHLLCFFSELWLLSSIYLNSWQMAQAWLQQQPQKYSVQQVSSLVVLPSTWKSLLTYIYMLQLPFLSGKINGAVRALPCWVATFVILELNV